MKISQSVELDKLYNFSCVTVTIPLNLQPLFKLKNHRHLLVLF